MNTGILIENKKVVALLLNRDTPNALVVIPLLGKYDVSMVGEGAGGQACTVVCADGHAVLVKGEAGRCEELKQ